MIEGDDARLLGEGLGFSEAAGGQRLLGQPHAVAVEAGADVHGEALDRPGVGDEEAGGGQGVDRHGVVLEAHRIGRHARERAREVAAHEVDDVVGVGLIPQRGAFFGHVLAAELQVVRAAREVVLEVADRAGELVAATPQFPVAPAAQHLVGADRLVARGAGVAVEAEVVAELAGAEFREGVLVDGAVPFALVDPARRILQRGRVGGDVDGRAQPVAAVGAVGLGLGPPLHVTDELVVLVQLVGELARVVAQLGVEGRAVEERARGRRRHRVPLVEEGAEGPQAVAQDGEAGVDVGVLVAGQPVAVGTDDGPGRGRDLVGREVAALQAFVFHVEVEAQAGGVAAALAHELGEHAGVRHLGRVGRRANEHLFEGAIVEVEAGRRGALGGVDAFDERAVLARIAVGEVGGLGAHGGAADVDPVQGDRRRRGQQGPHVAGVGNRGQALLVEIGLETGGRGIDDRRFAADRHRFLQRGHPERDIDPAVEAQGDAHAVALDRAEAGQLVVQGIDTGRHRGEAVDSRFVGDGRERAWLRRAGGRDRDAGQETALFVFDFTGNTAGRTRAAALRIGARDGQQHRGCKREQRSAPTCHVTTSCGVVLQKRAGPGGPVREMTAPSIVARRRPSRL